MEKIVPYLIIGAVALLILIILIKNICIVQQSRAYVIERLGAFSQVWESASTSSCRSSSASPAASA